MFTSRFLLSALALAMVAGCVTYQPKELDLARSQAQFETRSLRDPGLQTFFATHGQPAGDEWDLARLTLTAFYFAPELDVARAQVAEAEGMANAAEERPNPSFAFTPGYNKDAIGGVTPWIIGYALNIPVELRGKRTYRTSGARHKADVARFDLARVAWNTRRAVRRALIELHAAESTAGLWRDQKPLLAQAAQLVDAQVKAGDVSPLEAAQARIALNRAELAARGSERGVATARSRLAEAIGIPLSALAEARLSYRGLAEPAEPVAVGEARRWAAQNRADLLAALAEYAASQSALQLEIARQYPDLALGPGYQLDQGEGKWSLGLGVTLPIFDRNRGQIAAAQARREAAAARFHSLQNRVIGEVDRAISDFASALGDLDTIKTMRTNIEQQARTVQAQQTAGETSRLDLARAQIELADNARAELDARVRAEQALGALEDAVQRSLAWPDSAWRNAPRSAAN